jgi:hypothetical protein
MSRLIPVMLIWGVFAFFMSTPSEAHSLSGCHWRTVDEFQYPNQGSSFVTGMAARGSTVFAVGGAKRDNNPIWVVRRSLDHGSPGTWKNVDEFRLSPDSFDTQPTGVAINPLNGDVYVSGLGFEPTTNYEKWIVRKSADGGDPGSWVIDDFPGLPNDSESSRANSIAVDGRGNVYATGSIGIDLVTRRLGHGETTWTEVDRVTGSISNQLSGLSVVATEDGRVFVGYQNGPAANRHWVIRSSENGKTGWTTVDNFQLVPNLNAFVVSGAVSRNGTVVFVGIAGGSDNMFHWIVRSADSRNPTAWTTIDDFPDTSTDNTSPQAAAFRQDGRLFVTGSFVRRTAVDPISAYLTRSGDSERNDPFATSDFLKGFFEGHTNTSGHAATVDGDHHVFTGGAFETTGTNLFWIVRKLHCPD